MTPLPPTPTYQLLLKDQVSSTAVSPSWSKVARCEEASIPEDLGGGGEMVLGSAARDQSRLLKEGCSIQHHPCSCLSPGVFNQGSFFPALP